MQFNSFEFIILFLPLSIIGYYLFNKLGSLYGKLWLIAASAVFYVFAGWEATIALTISILLNYSFCLLIAKFKRYRKPVFILAIVLNVSALLYFKYHDFFISEISRFISLDSATKNLVLPLGISFFTFQQISYLVSVYEGSGKEMDFCDYLLYILYFPKLTMGPLVEPDELIPQFNDIARKKPNAQNIAEGLRIFSFGLFKKAVLADTFAAGAAWVFGNLEAATSCEIFASMLSYTFEIYFDFSGYSDMAVGISAMLNIDLPINFDSPYKALSIRDFWKRWHISLTKFLTNYVYIPLGGSRKGMIRTYINTMIVFIVSGIWHGANYTFILWGFLHGLLSVFDRIFEKAYNKLFAFVRWGLTFLCVNILWLLFASDSVGQWLYMLKRILQIRVIDFNDGFLRQFILPELRLLTESFNLCPGKYSVIILIFISLLICLIPENAFRSKGKKLTLTNSLFAAYTFIAGFTALGAESVFVYNGF